MDGLVASLNDNGGQLTIESPSSAERARWRRTIWATARSGAVPAGHSLRYRGRDSGDLVIWLEPVADSPPKTAPLVAVPADLRNAHPLVVAARKDSPHAGGWIDTRRQSGVIHIKVHKTSLNRALRLVQGLINEVRRRGYTIAEHDGYGCNGGLGIVIDGQSVEVTVIEESKRIEHVKTPAELANRYAYIPRFEFVPTGRLTLCCGHTPQFATLATDRQRWSVEERLGQAIAKIEERAEEAAQRACELQQQQLDARAKWELAMERARISFVDEQRIRWADSQLQAARHAVDLRSFTSQASQLPGLDLEQVEWLSWTADYADSIDPLRTGPRPPDLREPSPSDLSPYLPNGMGPWAYRGSG